VSLRREGHARDGVLEVRARLLGDGAHDALRLIGRTAVERELVLEPRPVTALAHDTRAIRRAEGAADLITAESDPDSVLTVANDTAADVRDAVVARALEQFGEPDLAELLALLVADVQNGVVEHLVVGGPVDGEPLDLL